MKTLIAIDGSPDATCALKTAGHLLNPVGREISLLCVTPPVTKRPKGEPRREYERRLVEQAEATLASAHASLPPGAGLLHRITEVGSPAPLIVERSRDHDLTVVGAKGKGTVGEVGLGPVASRVLEHAPGAVRIARELSHERGNFRVLIAADGSAASERAIELMRRALDLESAEVCLMHVVETPWIRFGLEEDWVTASEEEQDRGEAGELERELTTEGEEIVEHARRLLANTHLSISTSIVSGNPADELLSEADRGDYDLIVTGATGSRDLKHRMLGSVSTKVAWNAPCSVLVAKEPQENS